MPHKYDSTARKTNNNNNNNNNNINRASTNRRSMKQQIVTPDTITKGMNSCCSANTVNSNTATMSTHHHPNYDTISPRRRKKMIPSNNNNSKNNNNNHKQENIAIASPAFFCNATNHVISDLPSVTSTIYDDPSTIITLSAQDEIRTITNNNDNNNNFENDNNDRYYYNDYYYDNKNKDTQSLLSSSSDDVFTLRTPAYHYQNYFNNNIQQNDPSFSSSCCTSNSNTTLSYQQQQQLYQHPANHVPAVLRYTVHEPVVLRCTSMNPPPHHQIQQQQHHQGHMIQQQQQHDNHRYRGSSDVQQQQKHNLDHHHHHLDQHHLDQHESSAYCHPSSGHQSTIMMKKTKKKMKNGHEIIWNFTRMTILFAINHGCITSCLGLATSRLAGASTTTNANIVGIVQLGMLYISYTGSALMGGTTCLVKMIGSRNAMIIGMIFYSIYVGAFYIATKLIEIPDDQVLMTIGDDININSIDAAQLYTLAGAVIGGIGAALLWIGQGSYYAQAAEGYAISTAIPSSFRAPDTVPKIIKRSDATTKLATIFASIYLAIEVIFKLVSMMLLQIDIVSWSTIFCMYASIMILSIFCMLQIPEMDDDNDGITTTNDTNEEDYSLVGDNNSYNRAYLHENPKPQCCLPKCNTTLWLLCCDAKMKYMIGFNVLFGLAHAFVNSYVNGNVILDILSTTTNNNNNNSDITMLQQQQQPFLLQYIGILSAWVPCVAAGMTLFFGKITPKIGKGPIVIIGAICFACVPLPFLLNPAITQQQHHHGLFWLLFVYTMQGTGRATFESTLKAIFADYFSYETEGAYANIVVQNGIASAIGYVLTIAIPCSSNESSLSSKYCVQYQDGTYHDVFKFELLIVVMAIIAILGFWRASVLRKRFSLDKYKALPSDDYSNSNLVSPIIPVVAATATTSTAISPVHNHYHQHYYYYDDISKISCPSNSSITCAETICSI